jgi:hypothetical protein
MEKVMKKFYAIFLQYLVRKLWRITVSGQKMASANAQLILEQIHTH